MVKHCRYNSLCLTEHRNWPKYYIRNRPPKPDVPAGTSLFDVVNPDKFRNIPESKHYYLNYLVKCGDRFV